MGHSTYLVFLVSLSNFLVNVYTYILLYGGDLIVIFPSLLYFAVIGVIVYVPSAIFIGHWHNRHQLETDVTVAAEKNPYYAKILDKF